MHNMLRTCCEPWHEFFFELINGKRAGQVFNRKQIITVSVVLERIIIVLQEEMEEDTVTWSFSFFVRPSDSVGFKPFILIEDVPFLVFFVFQSMLRGRGGCYKHTFYGIESHCCMEATPSLACANKCVFCWR